MTDKTFTPDWTNQPPPPGSYRSIFKLGKPDEFKHPRNELIGMIMSEFGMSENDFSKKVFEGNEKVVAGKSSRFSREQIKVFENMAGAANVSVADYDRVKYSYGQTLKEVDELRKGSPQNITDLVIHPRDKDDVRNIVRYCDTQKIPVYVYGGGSSVVMGLTPEKGGVTLVMNTHMNRIVKLNETNHTVTVQPGMMGPDFENVLNNAPSQLGASRAYTCGHFPQSFEISSVGGWVVTLGSGQASTYYGDACDLVVAQEYVTPAGDFRTLEYPATAAGPKVNDIMKGSEGAFGVLVEVTMKVYRFMPENRQYFAFMFPTWETAVDASREIMQSESGMPAVFRISDPEETDRGLKLFGFNNMTLERFLQSRGMKPMQRCICMGTSEGEAGYAKHVKSQIKKTCKKFGAMRLPASAVKAWEKTRYKEPLMREDFMDYGLCTDTLETGVTWDNLHRLHSSVRAYIKKRPGTVCMTHASHFYPGGTNLYFIYVLKPDSLDEFFEFHRGIIDRIVENGGSISHHHGVGKMLAPWLEKHIGKQQLDVLRALKEHFDPNNIMNPGGRLALDRAEKHDR